MIEVIMFEALSNQPADSLLALIKAFQQDQRPGKIDLGVGVYRDRDGRTPVMRAVKAAEKILLAEQDSKKYLGAEGDPVFALLLQPIIFGKGHCYTSRLRGMQTPGGTGALRLGAELVARARPGAKVWLGTPSWPNHAPIFKAVGLTVSEYGSYDLATQALQFDRMADALSRAEAGDVVLLHGCCHNPTGIDFTADQWKEVAGLVAERRLLPFIDLAYQGLGQGLDEDAAGLRLVWSMVDEAMVAYSCDKNFGLYRERVGALYVMAPTADGAAVVESNLTGLARVNWSMPPDHGAAVVRTILEHQDLTADWRDELSDMCRRINDSRKALASTDAGLAFIAEQRGLFSNLRIDRRQVDALRSEYGIYMANSGRINLAGMGEGDVAPLIAALRAVGAVH